MIPWRKTEPVIDKPAPQDAKKVLVIKLGGLTSFVQSLAAAKAIRDYHVGARITLLTTDAHKDLAEKAPYFDVVETEGPTAAPAPANTPVAAAAAGAIESPKLVQIIARIRAAKYEMVYDLEGSTRTNGYFHGLKPWPAMWSGPAPGASHQFIDPDRAHAHPLDYLSGQLRAAGVKSGEMLPDLRWVRAALRDAPRLQPDFFGIRGSYIVLLPRGGDEKPAWPQAKYVELAKRIASEGATPVVLGGANERTIGAAIALAEPRAKNLTARTDLFQSITLAERASFVVGDDVDLMHVAAAAGGACIVLLSSLSEPHRAAPRGPAGVVAVTAAALADLPVHQVDRQLRNCGAYLRSGAA